MATYTPNLNLYMPDSSDDFGDFRTEHNDNMVKIDNAIGGGGGGGGHTIIDQSGNTMPNRTGLQFIGASVSDDSVNNKTVVTITGGGGGHNYSTSEQVVGTWINNKPLYEKTLELTSLDYDSNWHDRTHGIADIAIIVDIKAVCTTLDGYFYPVPTPRANTTLGFTLEFTATKVSYLNNWVSQPDKLYITIQYTKSTD